MKLNLGSKQEKFKLMEYVSVNISSWSELHAHIDRFAIKLSALMKMLQIMFVQYSMLSMLKNPFHFYSLQNVKQWVGFKEYGML